MSAAASARWVGVATFGGASTRYRVNIVPAAIALASSMLAELPRICAPNHISTPKGGLRALLLLLMRKRQARWLAANDAEKGC